MKCDEFIEKALCAASSQKHRIILLKNDRKQSENELYMQGNIASYYFRWVQSQLIIFIINDSGWISYHYK
jgi:hypothetical protein